MDDENRETFAELVSNQGLEINDVNITLPEGTNLFEDISFIRMELAFEINRLPKNTVL